MNYLHSKLSDRFPWYAHWHTGTHVSLLHFVILMGFVSSLTMGLQSPITEYTHDQLAAAGSISNQPYAAGRILVRFKAGVSETDVDSVLRGNGAQIKRTIPQIHTHVVTVPAGAEEKIRLALSHNPKIQSAELDYAVTPSLIPNDPLFSSQWFANVIGEPAGWDVTTGSSTVVVAVLDSGIGPSSDITENLVQGYDTLTGSTSVVADGSCLHGPAVAGTIATVGNNGIGPAGIAWHVKIMPITIANGAGSCYAYWSDVATGITYAVDHGAKVINVSYGGTSPGSTMQDAINYAWSKNVIFFASAGNDNTSVPMYPASANNAVSVAATQQASTASGDTKASYSSFGSTVDISAPGSSIQTIYGSGFKAWSGTSFSSPMTAGLAALVWSVNPKLSNAQVVDLMEKNADDLGTAGWDQYYGWGRINVPKTLAAAQATAPIAQDTTSPSVSVTAPKTGTGVSGAVTVAVSATDNMAVTKVELYKDGGLFATSISSPYSFFWDTTNESLATHSIYAKAYDASGNVGTSGTISVTVTKPLQTGSTTDMVAPKVSISSPKTGTKVKGNGALTISTSATDESGVASMVISADGKQLASCTTPSTSMTCSASWSGRSITTGTHTITVVATDVAANKNSSTASVTITK